MRVTITHVGHDGDEYVHSFRDVQSLAVDKLEGFLTVTGIPTNGSAAFHTTMRETSYPIERVLRVITEVGALQAVQS